MVSVRRAGFGLACALLAALGPPGAVHAEEPLGELPEGVLRPCGGAHDLDCVAHVTRHPDAADQRDRFAHCYLELWDEAALASRRCAPTADRADAASRAYFTCRDLNCTLDRRPQLGVALEGGGSKTSPFALGTLAGLQEAGLLRHVELIASASGGTYAAGFLFNRLFDRVRAQPGQAPLDGASDWFRDCIPSIAEYTGLLAGGTGLFTCNGDALLGAEDKADAERFRKSHPHAYQTRYYADILSPGGNLKLAGPGDKATGAAIVGELLAQHLLTIWPFDGGGPLGWLSSPHHIAHSLFNWPENFSPSRERYRRGIERAFAFAPDEWPAALASGGITSELFKRRREQRTMGALLDAYEAAQRHCRAAARAEGCGFPLWILGTTAAEGRSTAAWVTTPARDSLRYQFELTPLGYGSGIFGYARRAPPLALLDAVGASAAFLDDEQRLVTGHKSRFAVGATLHLLNANWTTRIANYNVSDLRRAVYRWVPWPFYGMPVFSGRERAPYIHLSDGGNNDNLSLLALLRRGTRDIVVAAGTTDRDGWFPSLCRTKNQLELDGMYALHMPGLANFDRVCNHELNDSDRVTWGDRIDDLYCDREFEGRRTDPLWQRCVDEHWQVSGTTSGQVDPPDLWRWRRPLEPGCVVIGPAAARNACLAEDSRLPGSTLARLYVLKPAIDADRAAEQLGLGSNALARLCRPEANDKPISWCSFADGAYKGRPRPATTAERLREADTPCMALAFIANNHRFCDDSLHGTRPLFPQHDFFFMTLNSSYTMFGAYYDLARHQASALGDAADRGTATPTAERLRRLRAAHAGLLGSLAAGAEPSVGSGHD